MGFITFNYEKQGPNQFRSVEFDRNSPGSNILINDPSWINANVDGETLNISLSLGVVNSLPAGTYEGTILLNEIFSTGPDGTPDESIFLLQLPVCLILTERQPAEIDTSSLEFYYQIGNAEFPADQRITIVPNYDFTVNDDQPWLTTTVTNTADSVLIDVGVNIQGLIPGTYNGVVSIVGELDIFNVPVTLVVDGELGTEDYLFITPEILRFDFTRFGFIPNEQNVSVNASGPFTIESASDWFSTTIIQGDQNTLSFDVVLNSLINDLGVGVFISEVVVRLGELTKRVAIEIDISQFIEELFEEDTLYFTDDDNIIRLASSDSNTNLSVQIDINYRQDLHRFKYAIPFFKGESKTFIGDETRKVIGKLSNTDLQSQEAKVYVPYVPALLNFQLSENLLYTDTIVRGTMLSNIRFIKGVTPANSKLTKLPEKVYLTRKGVISYHFLSDVIPENIVVSGAIDQQLPVSVERNELYSVLLPLQQMNLSVGDTINIDVAGISTQVQIKPEGIDHCILYWENIWGCWDSFECTGEITITDKYKYTKEQYRINRRIEEEKILEIDTTKRFNIDTGWIYSNAEVDYLASLFQSNNVYMSYKGELIKLNNKTGSFVASQTRRFKKSFKLTFENALQQ